MRNGDFEFTGSLAPEHAHSLKNEFGDITLNIPSDSAFNVSVETEFGEIYSDFPVTITGKIDPDNWEAIINDGGPNLKIFTRNGNINLIIFDQNKD